MTRTRASSKAATTLDSPESEDNERDSPETKEIKCDHCEETFTSLEQRRQHTHTIHNTIAVLEVDGILVVMAMDENYKYCCPRCNKLIKGYKGFVNHFKLHTDWEKPKASTKRSFAQFSFEEGCSKVLSDSDEPIKRKMASSLAFGLDLQPLKLLVDQPTAQKDPHNTVEVVLLGRSQSTATLSELVPPNTPFTAQIQFSSEDKKINEETIFEDTSLEMRIKSSNYKNLCKKLGPYIVLDDVFEQQINHAHNVHSLQLVPKLFTGCILKANRLAILIISCEVYSRGASIDEHVESKGASYPEELEVENRRYKSITTNTYEQYDGGQPIQKLMIGTTKFNILVTGSLLIYPHQEVSTKMGPSCSNYIINQQLQFAHLYFREDNVKDYTTKLNSATIKSTPDVKCVRQLTSGLHNPTTYLPYRSNLFSNNLYQPATLFTLCDFPSTNYGMTINNKSRVVSCFFKICCESVLNHESLVTADAYDQLLKNHDIIKKDEVDEFDELLQNLKHELDGKSNINILKFLNEKTKISRMAQTVSGCISKVNDRVEVDLAKKLRLLFN